MSETKSNIHLLSNVYRVSAPDGRIRIEDNPEFVGRISDIAALKKLLQFKYGRIGRWRIEVECIQNLPGIQDWQVRRMKGCDECDLAGPGERPWGFLIENGEYHEVCKCDKQECRLYSECRRESGTENASAQ